ncbi:MAG: hypothetical protein AAF696_30685 [Bacteroidota bacterium]
MKKLIAISLTLILSVNLFSQSKKAQKLYDKAYKAAQDGYAIKASVDLTKAISIDKEYAAAYELRALCFLAMNQAEAARKDFEEAAKLDPKMMRSLANLIDIYKKANNWKEVAVYAEMIAKHHPDNVCRATFDWAEALQKLDKQEEAVEKYKSFLSLNCREMKKETVKAEQVVRFSRE